MKNKIKKVLVYTFGFLTVGVILYKYISSNEVLYPKGTEKILMQYAGQDTLRTKAVKFLLKNMTPEYIEKYFPESNDADKNANYLIRNIDASIEKSKQRILSGEISEKNFLEYILPYRIDVETLEDWRTLGIDRFGDLYDDNLIKHCELINDSLMKFFKYTLKDYVGRTYSNLLGNPSGNCNGMTRIAAFSMRSNGIPVAIDFATWSNVKGAHKWNSLLLNDKNMHFMGAEQNHKNHKLIEKYKRVAKVYRETFLKETELPEFNPKKIISSINYIDVTKEYCTNCKDFSIELEGIGRLDKKALFLLCIYDGINDWTPVDYSFNAGNFIKFNDVCPNNLFILKKVNNGFLEYYGEPFILKRDGMTQFLTVNTNIKGKIQLYSFNSPEQEYVNVGHLGEEEYERIVKDNPSKFSSDMTYSLFLWKKLNWIEIDKKTSIDGMIIFENVPLNGLLKISSNEDKNNRPFIYQNGKQVWL